MSGYTELVANSLTAVRTMNVGSAVKSHQPGDALKFVTHLDKHLLQLLAGVVDQKLFKAIAPE